MGMLCSNMMNIKNRGFIMFKNPTLFIFKIIYRAQHLETILIYFLLQINTKHFKSDMYILSSMMIILALSNHLYKVQFFMMH